MLTSAIFLSGILMLASAQQAGINTAVVPLPSVTFSPPISVIHAVRGTVVPAGQTFKHTEVRSVSTVAAAYPMITAAAARAQLASLSIVAPPQDMRMDAADQTVVTPSLADSSSKGSPYGDSLSTYTGKTAVPDLHQNKHAVAQLKIIALNGQDDDVPAKTSHHDYCEPITGSRVCR
jgi:hypothetical protein